jgi:predicted transposase YbfD/YdcC
VKDPRRTNKGNIRHDFLDIIFLVISAVICGASNWEEIEFFGKSQIKWLKKHGSYKNGIPSHDTVNRVISSIEPKQFSSCFTSWINEISVLSDKEVVAIDGKSIRNSYDKASGKSAVHMVSAFASKNGLCLGQVSTKEKSNEITAIPELLENIAIKGSIVSIDAMGCQTKIADKIIEKKADYILAVKGNQGNLEQGIKDTVRFNKPFESHTETDFGHGRIEKRTCNLYELSEHIEEPERWQKLNMLIEIQSERIIKSTGDVNHQTRYYISSLKNNAATVNHAVRSHWSVENNLHWVLDVTFGEDASRKRQKFAAENFNTISKIALTLLANEKSVKASKKHKRLVAALNIEFREKVLKI